MNIVNLLLLAQALYGWMALTLNGCGLIIQWVRNLSIHGLSPGTLTWQKNILLVWMLHVVLLSFTNASEIQVT